MMERRHICGGFSPAKVSFMMGRMQDRRGRTLTMSDGSSSGPADLPVGVACLLACLLTYFLTD